MIFKIQNPKAGPFQLTFTDTLGKYEKLISITNLFKSTFIYCIVNLNTCKLPLIFFQMASILMVAWVLNSPLSLLKVSNMVILLFLLFYNFFIRLSLSKLCPLDNILLLINIITLLTIYLFWLSFAFKKSVLTCKLL